jgi:hypothetical protein
VSLTSNEQPIDHGSDGLGTRLSYEGVEVNAINPYKEVDYGVIIKAFEVEAANWGEEDYALAYHYRDVYGTRNFSERVRQQMNYYPGMHQTTGGVPGEDPQYTEAKQMADDRLGFWNTSMDNPDAFMNGIRQRQQDFDYTRIFGSDVSAKDRAKELGKMLTECVPCFDRLLDPGSLLPDGDLLEIHGLNIKIRTDILDKIKTLFRDPGAYIDICDLLKMLSHLCPQDLLAILALLTQFLAKLNLDVKFNIDFIIQLVGPILSPFLDALGQWLDKWIQMILAPILCVVDHINETLLIAQTMEIPLSDVSADVSLDLGIAAPTHQNSDGSFSGGYASGIGNKNKGVFNPEFDKPFGAAWGSWQWDQFNTPDREKYNPTRPRVPREEVQMAKEEISEAWSPSFSEIEREEQTARWRELKADEEKRRRVVPPPEELENRDGTRWSKDDIPNSEKHQAGGSWEAGYQPPENQRRPAEAIKYLDVSPLVNSIVQLRNILQAGVQYVNDWFTYVTQMIYDLLGTEVGWMAKKADNTMLKSRIIQLIMMVKSIMQAISKNGLECGTHSNFDPGQMKYILEKELNKRAEPAGASRFQVNDDGTIELLPPGRTTKPKVKDLTEDQQGVEIDATIVVGTLPGETISEPDANEQKSVESGIIIKDCFKSVSYDELVHVREWIADFEKRGGI